MDSRSSATAQSRFKNPFVRIRLFQILIPQLHFGDFFNSIGTKRTSNMSVPCPLRGVKRTSANANPTCQAFSQSLACKHNPSDTSRLVDLWPMPRFKDMNRSIPGLRSHVLSDGDMKIGVGHGLLPRRTISLPATNGA